MSLLIDIDYSLRYQFSRDAFRWCTLNFDVDKVRERETEANHGTEANQDLLCHQKKT